MRGKLGIVVFCALLAAACASSKPAEQPAAPAPLPSPEPAQAQAPEAPPETVYALRFHPGPKWVAGQPPFGQPGIAEHVKNMGAWAAAGKLMFGGPFLDSSGGMAVLRVASMDEAKKLAEADPCVVSGLMTTEIHPWLLAFTPEPDEKPAGGYPSAGSGR